MALERVPADIRATGGVARMVSGAPASPCCDWHVNVP
jgi:pyridoxal biosynthesis lyase PdxS